MELLLNLVWLLLALPAYWLWRCGAGARAVRRITALQFLLALGCALVLLFPVISATDDLHAMRAEMEESAASKRAVRQAGGEKHSAWVNRLQGPPVLLANIDWQPALQAALGEVSVLHLAPLAGPSSWHSGRAPPDSLLG
jgi:hypothetical protein